jgi:hypothetical protein
LLSEEVFVTGFIGVGSSSQAGLRWLDNSEALRLLSEAKAHVNVPMSEKRELISLALKDWPQVEAALAQPLSARAAELEKSHKRIRQAVSLRVRELTVQPQLPPDLLGVLVLQPIA